MNISRTYIFITVIIVAITLAITNSISFFIGIIYQPASSIYLGTIHYYEDYFFYLNHFFQGAHGGWLTVSRYTGEATPLTIVYWCNILLGKIGGLLNFTPVLTYNISVLILAFIALLIPYFIFRRIFPNKQMKVLSGFLFTATATSLINRVHAQEGGMTWWPFQIWRTPHFAYDRLGGAPHQLLITILFDILIYLYFFPPAISAKKYYPIIGITALLLTALQPVQSGVFLGFAILALLVFSIIYKNKPEKNQLVTLIVLIVAIGFPFIYMNNALNQLPYRQSTIWEASQHSHTIPLFLLKSIGPIIIFAAFGLLSRIKKLSVLDIFGLLLLSTSYILFMSDIPQRIGVSNLRFLFPASHIFFGLFAAYGIGAIARFMKKYVNIPTITLTGGLLILFILITAPTLIWEFQQKFPHQNFQSDQLYYLPNDVYAGFTYLENKRPYTDIVMANPASHMDVMVPALAGHTVYEGHMLATINFYPKQQLAWQFFAGNMSAGDAQKLISENYIRYILLTKYDGNRINFEENYPFLKKIFENTGCAIYTPK
jgi:hypothetical protein